MKTRKILLAGSCVLAVSAFNFAAVRSRAQGQANKKVDSQSAADCCGVGLPMQVRGSVQFFDPNLDNPIEGVADMARFKEEVFGRNFSLVIPKLPAGRYTVQIDMAETFQHAAGGRVMDISLNGKPLAQNLDIFAVAGFGKFYRVTGTAEQGGAGSSPLTIGFKAKADNAKFNVIRVLDANGTVVSEMSASDLHKSQTMLGNRIPQIKTPIIFTDPHQPRAKRIADLVSRLSLGEKVAQLQNDAPSIPRLNIPSYNYWSEALHGVAREGYATVFPQAIGMAATWNPPLIHQVADTISTEGRAKYYESQLNGNHGTYHGLSFWAPNINIFRDPRWGRGQETYGEDPFLTSRFGVAFITGMQGNDPKYLKVVACAKHYAVHSGPEPLRHTFDAHPTQQDLYDTYLPAFEAAVREGHVNEIMGAYSSINGVPACANSFMLTHMLRQTWGFDGHVVSDCGAITDIWANHKYVSSPEAAAAAAVKAGCDLECGNDYRALVVAVSQGLITEAQIDRSLSRVLSTRFRLGLFDPPSMVPWSRINATQYDTPTNSKLALKTAHESMVLLKNNGALPLQKSRIKKLAVIGPNADSTSMLVGNYNGDPSAPVSILQGLRTKMGAANVIYARGCDLAARPGQRLDTNSAEARTALDAARSADAVVYVGGLSNALEGEEMRVDYDGFKGGDRTRIELPVVQDDLLHALQALGKPIIFVSCSGSAVAMPWEEQNVSAILQAWYPGQAGGTAVADVLFGDYNPAGRLPVTFYRSTEDLPSFESYAMQGRTYRYFNGQPLWAFGHGLSYTKFDYGTPTVTKSVKATGSHIALQVKVRNSGSRPGDEVVQVYLKPLFADSHQAKQRLIAFYRVPIAAGASVPVNFDIPIERLRVWNEKANGYRVTPGKYELQIGAASDDIRVRSAVEVKS